MLQLVPGNSSGFYFHQNALTAFGDKFVYRAPTPMGGQYFVRDFRTKRSYQLSHDELPNGSAIVGPRTRTLYYGRRRSIRALHIDTLESREICELPSDLPGYSFALSADEKTLASGYYEGGAEIAALPRNEMFVSMFDARLRNVIFTIDIETGRFEEVYAENAWLGHFQFSPADPNTLMFCHEGPWERLDRVWLLDMTTREPRLVYKRKHPGEIAGHEFWGPDGKSVWFDLRNRQTGTFALANTELATGETTVYPLEPEQWSVHYNIGRRGDILCGDGGGMGPWIYRYEPRPDGSMGVSKLCSLEGHDYAAREPNVHMTRDSEWVLFTSNMQGENRVYAVGTRPA